MKHSPVLIARILIQLAAPFFVGVALRNVDSVVTACVWFFSAAVVLVTFWTRKPVRVAEPPRVPNVEGYHVEERIPLPEVSYCSPNPLELAFPEALRWAMCHPGVIVRSTDPVILPHAFVWNAQIRHLFWLIDERGWLAKSLVPPLDVLYSCDPAGVTVLNVESERQLSGLLASDPPRDA